MVLRSRLQVRCSKMFFVLAFCTLRPIFSLSFFIFSSSNYIILQIKRITNKQKDYLINCNSSATKDWYIIFHFRIFLSSHTSHTTLLISHYQEPSIDLLIEFYFYETIPKTLGCNNIGDSRLC